MKGDMKHWTSWIFAGTVTINNTWNEIFETHESASLNQEIFIKT